MDHSIIATSEKSTVFFSSFRHSTICKASIFLVIFQFRYNVEAAQTEHNFSKADLFLIFHRDKQIEERVQTQILIQL